MTYTINIIVENKPGVLYRITGLFTRRKINIENINAFETKKHGITQITLNADIDPKIVDTFVKQINKIIEVINIKYHQTHL